MLIVGAGIIGLACAEALAERGLRVQVVDRAEVGAASWVGTASWASAGMIAPLAEVPPAEMPEHDRFLEIGLRSRDLWTSWAPALEEATGQDVDYDRSGAFLVADRPHDDPGRLGRFLATARSAGEPADQLDAEAVRRLVPDAAPDLDFGLRLSGEHRVDNRKVCAALRLRLEAHGVQTVQSEVRKIERHSGNLVIRTDRGTLRAGRVLVAAGAWSGQIAGLPDVPVSPLRGQMLRLSGVHWPFQGCVRGTHFYAVRRRGIDLLIGATEDPAGFDCRVTPEGLAQLTGWLRRVFPSLADRHVVETWAGLRPATPDGRPILEQVESDLWIAAGHHRNGILLTPWTALTMARWIVDGAKPDQQDLFAVDRFAQSRVIA